MKQTMQKLPLPYADMGNGIAMVALGGISRLPEMTHDTAMVTLSSAPHSFKNSAQYQRGASVSLNDKLDDSAIAVCKQMGISEEDYKKTLVDTALKDTPTMKPSLAKLNAMDLEICEKMGIDQADFLRNK